MKPLQDFIGQRFGSLVVIARATNIPGAVRWKCRCDCGVEKIFRASNLRSGTKSCGCKRKEGISLGNRTHWQTGSKTYVTWQSMKARCERPCHEKFHLYGGRGITICERWKSFENFLADMGERPAGKTLERVNNDGNYEPSNCRWANQKEQSRNRRGNVWVLLNGERMILEDAALRMNMTAGGAKKRALKGNGLTIL